ncbi:C-type lectin domain family 4 member E-like [Tachysurus fulvidraco]|uniref:C-type lectin domain family 4 member E-like n=1 Tax=Tachysurus fulvidraco TaxID=1234273 RepID=UPI001FEEFB5B|nr:C-type lectin domain family 4 member E-like [Tachysurus fulvidraco]
MTRERDRLQISYDNVSVERDQLHGERNQLQSERDELQKWSKLWNYTIHHSLKYFTTKRTSWNKTREECRSKGADLVIINSQEEQEYISGVFAGEAWIGLHDTVQEGKWMWVDGTEVTTEFWWKGEPNDYDGIEDCAATGSKYAKAELTTWADYSCKTDLQAICEKRANI